MEKLNKMQFSKKYVHMYGYEYFYTLIHVFKIQLHKLCRELFSGIIHGLLLLLTQVLTIC